MGAETAGEADKIKKKAAILKACQDNYDDNEENCNFFVQAVIKQLTNVVLTGTANSLVDYFSTLPSGWYQSPDRTQAIQDVNNGRLVVAGLRGPDHSDKRTHGHLAVVVPGPLYHAKYPVVWCGGSSLGRSKGDKTVGEVWSVKDRDNVGYYVYALY